MLSDVMISLYARIVFSWVNYWVMQVISLFFPMNDAVVSTHTVSFCVLLIKLT